ncbi:unnamed protein product [Rhizophagus irregularis]|nr:unnamed protein product [Rhizophagus irregularis]
MDISNQNLDTTKPDVKSLWIDRRDGEYQVHATIFSTDATTESDETISFLKKVNIMDLEKRKEVYGVCGECNEPDGLSDLQTHPQAIYTSRLLNFENLPEPVNSTETISSSSSNPISECLDCELNESDLNQDNVE